jgi:hypothetical protein
MNRAVRNLYDFIFRQLVYAFLGNSVRVGLAPQPTVQNVLGKKRHHRCFGSVALIEKVKKFGDDIRCAPT